MSVSVDDKSKHNKPALYHQNQPPDSGSVHESQRRKLWLSRHRSHRHTCCVCFCFRGVLNFFVERRSEPSTACPPATKSPFLLMTNQNISSPALYHQSQPPDSGSVHESQQQQLRLSLHRIHRHTYCVRFCYTSSTIFRGEKRHN